MKNEVIESCGTCDSDPLSIGDDCAMDCRLKEVMEPVVYYDDEELDVYQGRSSADYTDEETDEFRYILETMLAHDVPGWVRSLELRGVALPDGVKDEVLLFL